MVDFFRPMLEKQSTQRTRAKVDIFNQVPKLLTLSLYKVLMITNTNAIVYMSLLELCCWDRIQKTLKIFDMSCIYNKCLRTMS